tara:strand:+ start:63 stop:506 length:444 start_codon:yes stop_codon:yes gene_type:complete
MERKVFFCFDYQRDLWRVKKIINLPHITSCAAAGFLDDELWEETEMKGDEAVKKLIDDSLENTSVTVLCIGERTVSRKFIDYEIEQSIRRGNGIVGIQIHHLKDTQGNVDSAGNIPYKIKTDYKVYKYVDHEELARHIEEAARGAGK